MHYELHSDANVLNFCSTLPKLKMLLTPKYSRDWLSNVTRTTVYTRCMMIFSRPYIVDNIRRPFTRLREKNFFADTFFNLGLFIIIQA